MKQSYAKIVIQAYVAFIKRFLTNSPISMKFQMISVHNSFFIKCIMKALTQGYKFQVLCQIVKKKWQNHNNNRIFQPCVKLTKYIGINSITAITVTNRMQLHLSI